MIYNASGTGFVTIRVIVNRIVSVKIQIFRITISLLESIPGWIENRKVNNS